MLKRRFWQVLACSFLSFLVISCGSAPQVEETPPAQEPPAVEEPKTEPLAEPPAEVTPPPVEEAPKEEPPATDNTEDIAKKNSTSLKKAQEARQQAIDAGVDKAMPKEFEAVDAQFNDIQDKMSKDPNGDYSEQLKDIAKKYEALRKLGIARDLKQKIDEQGLIEADKDSYMAGVDAYGDAMLQLSKQEVNGTLLLASANVACDSFYKVYNNAYAAKARDERLAAFKAKRLSDEIKCAVAAKDEYKKAVDLFKKGDSNYVTGRPDLAYENYSASREKFQTITQDIAQKRLAAQGAIDLAKEKTQESQNAALQADKTNPIDPNAPIAGIEADDAVLLEADTFADPEADVEVLDENPPEVSSVIDTNAAIEAVQQEKEASANPPTTEPKEDTTQKEAVPATEVKDDIIQNDVNPTTETKEDATHNDTNAVVEPKEDATQTDINAATEAMPPKEEQ